MGAKQGTAELELSPLDQTGPRLYVHKFYCFAFPDPAQQAQAVTHLEQRLSATLLRWPFIAGSMRPATCGKNMVRLHYPSPIIGHVEHDILTVKNLTTDEFPYSWDELSDGGMPPRIFDFKILSSVPEWPEAGATYPVLAMQANFINRGLILCFAFHHAVTDGGSFVAFIREFGAGTQCLTRADSGVAACVDRRISYSEPVPDIITPLSDFPEYRVAKTRPKSCVPVTTRILQFSAETIKRLEDAVGSHLRSVYGREAWVSSIACLSSLVWVAVVRARRARLNLDERAKIGVAVNVRNVMRPKLPEDYFGNAMLHTHATATVSEFLEESTSADVPAVQSSVPVAIVAKAAWYMRQAVGTMDAAYCNERLDAFSALSDPAEVCRAYDCAIDSANTGIDFSSWREQGADVEFNIPGTKNSTMDFWRKAWSPNEGAYNILPRKGGSKGPADWEISLGLSVEDMERVCAREELGAWVKRVLE